MPESNPCADTGMLAKDVLISMSKRANYLLLATECEELASASTSKASSWRIRQMADRWRDLAESEPRDPGELH